MNEYNKTSRKSKSYLCPVAAMFTNGLHHYSKFLGLWLVRSSVTTLDSTNKFPIYSVAALLCISVDNPSGVVRTYSYEWILW